MRSELFDDKFEESTTTERWSLHHRKMLRTVLGEPVLAAKGAMVAYQGQVTFEHKSAGSIGKMMRRLVTSEDTPLMTVHGQGEVFFADTGKDIFLLQLEDDGVSVNGSSLLAMDANLEYDVHRVKGAGMMSGGMFNTLVQGRGTVALTSDGQPLILDCSEVPTAVDINAAVCWSASLVPQVVNSMNVRSMMRGGSGEAFQYLFHGPGMVVVQPSEGPVVPPHSHGSGS